MALPYDILYIHKWKHVIRLCMYLHHICVFQDPFATHLMIDNLTPHTTYEFLFYSLNIYTIRRVRSLDPLLLLVHWDFVTTHPGGLSKYVCLLTCIGNCVSVLHTVCFMRFMREGGSLGREGVSEGGREGREGGRLQSHQAVQHQEYIIRT